MDDRLIQIVEHYGKANQAIKLSEECSELVQAMTKLILQNPNGTADDSEVLISHVAEEMADVLIMIGQVKYILNITDADLDAKIEYKIERTLKRMDGDSA